MVCFLGEKALELKTNYTLEWPYLASRLCQLRGRAFSGSVASTPLELGKFGKLTLWWVLRIPPRHGHNSRDMRLNFFSRTALDAYF